MPELPEVEMVARGLRASLVGRVIAGVEVRWPRSIVLQTQRSPDPAVFARRLTGQAVTDVRRRGKWVVMSLSTGDTLLVHLRMTGRLILESEGCLPGRHLRVLFLLDDGRRLHFIDQRKFGRMVLTDEPQDILGDLGPEPLDGDFTPERFKRMLARRRGRIKPLLLNQRFLAGLGNIYTDEALWRAQVHPLRRADTLSFAEVQGLHGAVRAVLRAAIESGGTTLSDGTYQQADGQPGRFAGRLAVYGRAGQPCLRCGSTVERITVSQRGTHVCPCCQPLGRSGR
jgi:formamidopyrimidine-DNA glycosylase